MYTISFEINGREVVKKAKTEKEVRRIIFAYTVGNSYTKELKVQEILNQKNI